MFEKYQSWLRSPLAPIIKGLQVYIFYNWVLTRQGGQGRKVDKGVSSLCFR